MKKAIAVAVMLIYLAGFTGMFLMHTQMPVTFGLAVARSFLWPVSLVRHELTPRGVPQQTD